MYQFSNNVSFRIQTDEQKNILNSVASELQEQQSIVFENAREFTLNLVAEYRRIQLENISLKSEINANADAHLHSETNAEPNADLNLNSELNSELNADADLNTDSDTTEIKQQIIAFLGYENNVTDTELLNDCLSIITESDSMVKQIATHLNLPLETATTETIISTFENKLKVEIQPNSIIIVPKTEENPKSFLFVVPISEAQHYYLDFIARARVEKGDDKKRLHLVELLKKMIFNKGVLLNWHEEFNTYLTNSRIKKIENSL